MLTSSLHHFVEFALDVQLWVFGADALQFDGHFFASGDGGACGRLQG